MPNGTSIRRLRRIRPRDAIENNSRPSVRRPIPGARQHAVQRELVHQQDCEAEGERGFDRGLDVGLAGSQRTSPVEPRRSGGKDRGNRDTGGDGLVPYDEVVRQRGVAESQGVGHCGGQDRAGQIHHGEEDVSPASQPPPLHHSRLVIAAARSGCRHEVSSEDLPGIGAAIPVVLPAGTEILDRHRARPCGSCGPVLVHDEPWPVGPEQVLEERMRPADDGRALFQAADCDVRLEVAVVRQYDACSSVDPLDQLRLADEPAVDRPAGDVRPATPDHVSTIAPLPRRREPAQRLERTGRLPLAQNREPLPGVPA